MNYIFLKKFFILSVSYATTAGILLLVLLNLRNILPPETLQAITGYIFISSLAAGLEPGTVKSKLLNLKPTDGVFKFDIHSLVVPSLVKAIAFTPLLVIIWNSSSNEYISFSKIIALSPFVVIIGFITTEVRASLDSNGRYISAILLKQGSISIALLVIFFGTISGIGVEVSIFLSLLIRYFWLLLFIRLNLDFLIIQSFSLNCFRKDLSKINESKWLDFAMLSLLASFSGSLDRFLAFKYLDSASSNDYFIIFEVVSKFWLIPYILVPIVFSEEVRNNSKKIFKKSIALIAGLGFIFVLSVLILNSLGNTPPFNTYIVHGVIYLVLGVVITSFSMIFISKLQATGHSKSVVIISLFVFIISIPIFYTLILNIGIEGVFIAWLVKSLIEVTALIVYLLIKKNEKKLISY